MMTSTQASEYLHIPYDNLFSLVAKKIIPYHQRVEHGWVMFEQAELDAWEDSCLTPADPIARNEWVKGAGSKWLADRGLHLSPRKISRIWAIIAEVED
jgi:hypothetical protein